MSLFNTHSAKNREVSEPLTVKYRQDQVTENGLTYWKISRFARKRYRYFGMTEAAAKSCAKAMIALYTRRSFPDVYWNGSQFISSQCYTCTSDVQPTYESGDNYAVSIDVDEEDVKGIFSPTENFDAHFSIENARDYEEDDALRITEASRLSIVLSFAYEQTIPGFNPGGLTLRYKTSPSDPIWQDVPSSSVDWTEMKWRGCPSADNAPDLMVQLVYTNIGDHVESNVMVPTESVPNA